MFEKIHCNSKKSSQKNPTLGAPLVIDAKSSSTLGIRGLQPTTEKTAVNYQVDTGTGELVFDSPVYCPITARLERYALQSASRKILKGSSVVRVNNCLRVRMKGHDVKVLRSVDHNTCSYSGLQTCASVWSCPVCAAKISERRRFELKKAIEQHKDNGGDVLLLTLTNPHYLGDKLSDVLEGQKKALKYFNGGRAASDLNKSIGLIGQVRALEVTHGRLRTINNGWHPHYHILLFVDSGLNLDDLRANYFDRWLKACLKAGLSAPIFDYFRLDDGSKAAAYASKWGLESEMTKGHIKKANKGETPFDFLRAVLANTDKQAAALFREFSEVFKGKSQLFWSHGLKAKFNLDDSTDDELAAKQDDLANVLGTLDLEDWQLILKNDMRGELLQIAKHGWDAVERLLIELRNSELIKLET